MIEDITIITFSRFIYKNEKNEKIYKSNGSWN